MIAWEVMRDLGQLSLLILGWVFYIGFAINGLALAMCVLLWVWDFIRKEFF
jgi:hypothetical protein